MHRLNSRANLINKCQCHIMFIGSRNITLLQAAAREKAAAGEGRNIEHVAEADDRTHTADTKKRKKTSSQQKAENPGLPEASQAKKRKSRTKAK